MRFIRLLLLVAFATPAFAAPEPVSEARAHYQKGADHYAAERYAEAVTEFKIAYDLSKRPAILYNLARAEEKLGHEEAAIDYLQRYLVLAPDSEDAPAVRAEISARQRALADAQARKQAEADAEAARKQAEENARRAEEERKKASRLPTWPAYAAWGVGGAVLLTGIILGGVAVKTADDVSNNHSGGGFDKLLESRGQNCQDLGIAFDVIGVALAGAGVGWYLWARRDPEHAAPPRVTVAPTFGGFVAAGRF